MNGITSPLPSLCSLNLGPTETPVETKLTDDAFVLKMMKPQSYTTRISWDQHFMGMCLWNSCRSTCAKWKTACILVKNHDELALGYNGTPAGHEHCMDYWHIRWQKSGGQSTFEQFLTSQEFQKNHRIYSAKHEVHAEMNAILKAGVSCKGATLYTLLSPCQQCTKAIIQAGIIRVVYRICKYQDSIDFLIQSGIQVEQIGFSFEPQVNVMSSLF